MACWPPLVEHVLSSITGARTQVSNEPQPRVASFADVDTVDDSRCATPVVVDMGKPEKAAEWRAKLPTQQEAVASDPPPNPGSPDEQDE